MEYMAFCQALSVVYCGVVCPAGKFQFSTAEKSSK